MTDPRYQVLASHSTGDEREFAISVLVGLSESPKTLSSRYFYDTRGSELFQQITDLDEYYPTAVENSILTEHAESILAPVIDAPFNLVDLGAGDGRKTKVLLRHLRERGADCRYVPIDISESAVRGLTDAVAAELPGLEVQGLVSEYFSGIEWLERQSERKNLVLFLGSNLGNFNRPSARAFLRRLWNALDADDYVLIGFDLKKDIDTLLRAYNDSKGVTSEFNLNLLRRINRELDANFDVEKFQHFSTYDVTSGAMRSYLLSLDYQTVRVEALRQTFEFKPFEPIHTEYSFKYLDEDVLLLAERCGFVVEQRFWDTERRFVDALWRVDKQ